MTTALLSMTGISKSFSGVPALKSASLDIGEAEVHALIGQNGAGKSTLIKILTGVYRRDHGSVVFADKETIMQSPREAQETGISTIYQELTLVPLRSVTENVMLGYEPKKWGGRIDWKQAHQQTREILTRFGIEIDVRAQLGEFSTAIQQLVAIARAVSLDARLVIMDEPTSSLDDREIEVLFSVVRNLKKQGVSVLYVSHFLDELFAICDKVTVMRDGATVARKNIAECSKLELVADMLGRDMKEIENAGMTDFGQRESLAGKSDTLLQAKSLSTARHLKCVDICVHRGEIVGLGGLLGSGRTEVARAIFGVDRLTNGEITLRGNASEIDSPAAAIKAKVGMLSEDRKAEGIVPEMSVRENLTLALLPKLTKNGQIDRNRERELVESYVNSLGIKIASIEQPIRELSGGNQQKVLLARWLATKPDLLILDEPTRGVDVGAKLEIQQIIRKFVEKGCAVLLISSEFEELVEGADKIVVLQNGTSVTELHNPGITENMLVRAMAHHHQEGVAP